MLNLDVHSSQGVDNYSKIYIYKLNEPNDTLLCENVLQNLPKEITDNHNRNITKSKLNCRIVDIDRSLHRTSYDQHKVKVKPNSKQM